MKHSLIVTSIILGMFITTQLIGLFVVASYNPSTQSFINGKNETQNYTSYNLPYGLEPPAETNVYSNLLSILISIVFAVLLMLVLINYKAEKIIRFWFFFVVIVAMAVSIKALLPQFNYASLVSLIISIPLAIIKVFKRNIIVHNFTELLIYPGIAVLFIPLLNTIAVMILLIIISIYDIYAVWHAGFMQKMAKYQIQKVKVFAGFFIPYISSKYKNMIKSKKGRKVKVNVAILGGGDVVFPIIAAGVVLREFSTMNSLFISIGATIALGLLLLYSQKGKFYPAMPFISAGIIVGFLLSLLF